MPSGCSCVACNTYRGAGWTTIDTDDEPERETRYCGWCETTFDSNDSGWDDYCSTECYERDNDCYEDPERLVHNYSWTPDLNFLRADDDPDEHLYLGFELEVPSNREDELAQAIYDGPGREEQVLYCKEDGSIQGVEIVSHPMTHKYLRESPLLGMFRPSSEVSQYVDGTPNEGYGLHVHVSRKGFRNEAHALRWLLMIYRNEELTELVARRNSNQWAGFRDKEACKAKAMNRRHWSRSEQESYRERMRGYGYEDSYIESTLRAEMSGPYSGERYVAVNAQNAATFEVRVFRSTWTELEFRAALDFVHATVTYTRGMRAADALRGGLTAGSFFAWLTDKPEYAALVEYLTPHVTEDGLVAA